MSAPNLMLAPDTLVRDRVSVFPVTPPAPRHAIQVRCDLRASTGDGAMYSLMVGIGETYLPAFVLALGLGDIAAGLITTLPLMLGSLLQLITPWAVAWLQSSRKWVVICARVQAGSLLLLLPLALAGAGRLSWLVFPVATLYWAAGLAAGPAWNTWIEHVIPCRIRPRFFAARSRICQGCSLGGFLLGGLMLQTGRGTVPTVLIFGGLFAAAALARWVSARCLAAQSEGRAVPAAAPPVPADGASLGDTTDRGSVRLVLYLLAMQSSVYIASPFFTPFMLSKLQFSYLDYTLILSLAFVGKMLALPLWGRLAQRWGAWRLLWIGGVGIAPLSSLWLVSQARPFLAGVQVLSGVTWAAHELAMLLLFVEAIPRQRRMGMLTLYNLGNASAMVCGGAVGGMLLSWMGETYGAYLTLFALSSLARVVSLSGLLQLRRSRRPIAVPSTQSVLLRPTGSIEPTVSTGRSRDAEKIAA